MKSNTLNGHTYTMNTHPTPPSTAARLRRIFAAALFLLALGAGGLIACAADANPPDRLTYQGYLVDANGVPLATNNPINYDVVFRIYTEQTVGTLVWAEKQTVTVDKGRFSVLLGEGAANASDPRPALYTVFASATASDRFLDLTVTIDSAPLNIAPRLRLLPSPYAFHARTATALVSPNGSNLVSTVNGELIVKGTLNATGITGDGANLAGLNASGISVGTLADARLSANVPLKNGTNTFTGNNIFNAPVTVSSTLGIGVGGAAARGRLDVGGRTGSYFLPQPNSGFSPAQNLSSALTLNYSAGSYGSSIYSEDNIICGGSFIAFSDERIKRIVGRSSPERDLNSLLGIEVADYSFIDVLAKGSRTEKKVIAQQVEKIYPNAVTKTTGDIPDIYQKATIKNGWVKLVTNLKKGERVRLISPTREGIYEVLEVSADQFRTDFAADGDQVFVFGREVQDFRTVDYTAISMLNVSATQELAKRQQELIREMETLRKSEARIAELEQKAAQVELLAQKAARVDGLERDVTELKKLVARLAGVRIGEQPAADLVPASLNPTAKP